MDAFLRRSLRGIAADRLSGASQLAAQACRATLLWLGRSHRASPAEFRELARAVLRTQPAMAPITRVALESFHAADEGDPGILDARLRNFLVLVESGPARIARRFKLSLPARRKSVVLTHSYSGTVVRALISARSRIDRALCSEGRPNYEGRRMARELAFAGLKTELTTDSAITEFVRIADAVLIGADAMSDLAMRNKVGTSALVACALQQNVPVWVLADTSKLLPRALCHGREKTPADDRSPQEVWPRCPPGVRVHNPYFAWTRFRPGIRILTEAGWTTPRGLRKVLARLHLPRSWPSGLD